MAVTEAYTFTEAVGATEHSVVTDTAGPDVTTVAGVYQLFLDLADMVNGDILQVRIYEKARSGDAQGVVEEMIFVNVQATPLHAFDAVALLNGWDMTVKAIAGTITVLGSIRKAG